MESLIRLCWRLDHSTPNGYWPLSLRGRRLGVRLVMAVVPQPTSSRGRRSRGRNLFIVAIMGQSVTQGSGGCKVGFGPRVWTYGRDGRGARQSDAQRAAENETWRVLRLTQL